MAARLEVAVLDAAGESHAVFAVGELEILNVSPHDGRRPLVGHVDQILAVVFEQGVLVVALLLRTLAHDQRLDAPHARRPGRGVGVDRDEEVAPGLVGNVGPRLQVGRQVRPQSPVRRAGVDHLHARHPLLNELSEFERHLQREVLFIDPAVVRAGEFSPVPGVDDHDFDAVRNIPRRRNVHKNSCGREGE